MTTPPGQDPRSGPTRSGPARPAQRGVDSGWSGGGQDGRGGGQGRGPAGPGRDRDGADGRRGGNAPGPGDRARGRGRDDSDPWRNLGAPARGQSGRGNDAGRGGSRQDWDGRDPGGRNWDGRDSGGRDWDGQGAGGRGRADDPGGDRGRRGYPGDGWETRRRDGAGDWGSANRATGPRGSAPVRWLGTLRTRTAIYIMLGAAVLGMFGTLVTGSEPGSVLEFFVIVGSVAAAVGIQRRAVYLLIPLPALVFFVTAVLTGAVKDRSVDGSSIELGVSFYHWIAYVFFSMCATTIIVLVIAGVRWLLSLQLVSGRIPNSADSGERGQAGRAQRADRDPRPPRDRDPWGAVGPWDARDNLGSQRASRGQSDPWADRRPAGRGQQDGQYPASGNRPADRALPPDRRDQRDQRDDRDPRGTTNQRGDRDRRDPRDPWGQR